jgi:hypothetical protein
MEIIYLFHGLGNQMCQYAFYSAKKAQNSKNVYLFNKCNILYGMELEKCFNIKINNKWWLYILHPIVRFGLIQRYKYLGKKIAQVYKYLGINIIKESVDLAYVKNVAKNNSGLNIYIGGWHSPRYYSEVEEIVRDNYKFVDIDQINEKIVNQINAVNSVSIHVRRGDYVNVPENAKIFDGICTKEYYQKAMEHIEENVQNPVYYLFCGGGLHGHDYDWFSKNLCLKYPLKIISHNQGTESWKDMYLMSHCKHNIIANSSFSWWAAYLNQNINKIVISPNRFTNMDIKSEVFLREWVLDGYE